MNETVPEKFIALVEWRDFLAIVHRRKNYVILPASNTSDVCSMMDMTVVEIGEDKKPTGDFVYGLVSWVEFVGKQRIVSFEVRKISNNSNRPDCPYFNGQSYEEVDPPLKRNVIVKI